jgi:hypothetical protein
MAWRAFQSRHLNGGEYDPETRILTIQFVNGAVWQYGPVEPAKADILFQTGSPGTFFHDQIRNNANYRAVQVAEGATKTGRRSARRF